MIIEKLNTVNSLLAALLSKIDGLGGITDVLAPQFKLSDQAFAILAAFVDSGSSLMSEMRMHGFLFLNLHSGGQISADDQRFLQDDLDTLCALGFIVKERSSRDAPYRLTRSAQQFVSASRASSTRATA